MMKFKTRFIAIMVSTVFAFTASAKGSLNKWMNVAEVEIVSSEVDPNLDQNHAQFELYFIPNNAELNEVITIELSCNGVIQRLELDSTRKHTITVSPGSYLFMIARNGDYKEIITDSITILPSHKTQMNVRFNSYLTIDPIDNQPQIISFKPVIYGYSPEDIQATIRLNYRGEFTFTYPTYHNGWETTIEANGGMTVNQRHYPYLFWEGVTENDLSTLVDYSNGFVVKQHNVIAFLEEKLTEMGFNDQEKTDFITFWGPRMSQSSQGIAQFLVNEEYDAIATITVSPKPDGISRIYLLWTPLPSTVQLNPTPQVLPHVNRTGFYLIEWGGSEIPYQNETSSTH